MSGRSEKLRVGDWVEVRSKDEILRTLDNKGQLDGMPFMPEMFAFCGKRFQVYKRAHKTCDTAFPVRGRRVSNAVHLETRCNGAAHGGCEATCLLFWKTDWLKPLRGSSAEPATSPARGPAEHDHAAPEGAAECTETDVSNGAQSFDPDGGLRYFCQATQLHDATTDLAWWDIRQYVEDYRSGNVTLWEMVQGAVYFLYYGISNAGLGVGRPMRWFYDKFHFLWGGTPFPRKWGTIPAGQPTPSQTLDVQPGELVRIKLHDEILKTLNTANKNRGLYFDAEEVPYCGGTFRVLKRVARIINERTGRMQEMKGPCVILDSVICRSRYSECRLFCPRSIYPYWREIWMERVAEGPSETASENQKAARERERESDSPFSF